MYKRIAGEGYKLKLNASRKAFGEIIKKYPSLPFTLRNLVNNARMGLPECVNHDLLQPYPVLHEKPNTLVAQFKATVLLLPNGSDRVTSAPIQELKSEKKVSPCLSASRRMQTFSHPMPLCKFSFLNGRQAAVHYFVSSQKAFIGEFRTCTQPC